MIELGVSVSVIIPAHNAAETIAETLKSLIAQTFLDWEAIVIDDGSSDQTAAIAMSFAEKDARICTVSLPREGASAARNSGISMARFGWLLFLDADDWILPRHLERLTREIVSDPTLDIVHCGWARVSPDGVLVNEEYCPHSEDQFATLACRPAFVIHACIVRQSLVKAVGGFDKSFRTCEDWDLWQRIARTGARFRAIRESLARYRMSKDSASLDGFQMLKDGLRVLAQGHSPDLRVHSPHPAHANGLSTEQLPSHKFYFLCWCASLVIGCSKDACSLLDAIGEDKCPQLDPHGVAEMIFRAIPLSTSRLPSAWSELWPSFKQRINEFLLMLETRSLAQSLTPRVLRILERFILTHSKTPRPLAIGATLAVRIEVTEPIHDINPPASVERLLCAIELEGEYIGTTEIPVCDGTVTSYVLTDAITADFTWPILGRFFERAVYPDLRVGWETTGISLWRGDMCLANLSPENKQAFWSQVHDLVGWTVFLQEIWGRQDWTNERFYDPQAVEAAVTRYYVNDGYFTVEVSGEIPDIEISGKELNVVLSVGGIALGVVNFSTGQNIIRAHEIRTALTKESGFELCRAAVREGLLGKPMAKLISLRDRLATVSTITSQGCPSRLAQEVYKNAILSPALSNILSSMLLSGKCSMALARRNHTEFGTSVSRRAMLPSKAFREIGESSAVVGEAVIKIRGLNGQPEQVVYAPDIILDTLQQTQAPIIHKSKCETVLPKDVEVHGRGHFETIFSSKSDPWKYTSPYEQTKYEQTLGLLPSSRIGRALELACAEGHFTAQLAPRVGSLIAADISKIELSRAAERCADLKNINFMNIDLARDSLPGRFDLIVCSEVLYYVNGREALEAVARKFSDALEPDGYILLAHANLVVDEPDRPGFDWDHPFGAKVIGETFASISSLVLIKELRTPLYRIQLFRHTKSIDISNSWIAPEVIEFEHQPTPLLLNVAARVLWHGGKPKRYAATQAIVTNRLPILMYHRVAPTGSSMTARYRVVPEVFEEQLRYLRDAGYYSIRLEDWHAAMKTRNPLPGRAVLITFDDGYLDFLTYAWPLLKCYGFSATVFLVAGKIGSSNSWDILYGEEVPLLGWNDILQLKDNGVEFGSHSISHTRMTALSSTEIVREAMCSRAILQKGLGTPVRAFAYPFGEEDRVVQHLIGACGYIFGLSCRKELSSYYDPLLSLPRLEVFGSDTLQEFVAMLHVHSTHVAG